MKSIFVKTISFVLILLVLSTIGYGIYSLYFKEKNESTVSKNSDNIQIEEEKPVQEEPPIIEYVTYDMKAADKAGIYFEEIVNIKGQYTYYSHPIKVEKEKKVKLVVYSHGSNTTVIKDFSTDFMKDLQAYGKFFSEKGYAFIASNQHGMNYGSAASIQDIENSIKYMKDNYVIDEKVNHIGFSMGGLPAIYHSMQYPKTVSKLALLAPVTYSPTWKTQNRMQLLKGIDIKIWHGTKDVNVGHVASEIFISDAKIYKLNVELESLEGKTHWDVDTELKEKILKFYEE